MSGIRIRARTRLLHTAQGGRIAPLVAGSYRPNHNFGEADNGEMDMAFIDFAEGETLHPGEEIERDLRFWSRPGLSEVLTPGREWRIQEGPKLVGVGTVLELLQGSA
jgi:hypothetical protein